MPEYKANWHHELLCEYLDALARGEIKKLMVFMPPQHGKSQLVSRHLPAYLLGLNPKTKIVGSSYSADLSTQFNRAVQRIIDSKEYSEAFPNTRLNSSNVVNNTRGVLRNADVFEIVEHFGFYKSVGVGGSLTGTPADIAIIDDPVKDAVQATSLTYQFRVLDWYESVLKTRLHNESKIVLTMTRWDKGDLAGRILDKEKGWEVLTLEGIKDRVLHPKDPRKLGEALWGERHSIDRLQEIKESSERTFLALYQQTPQRTQKGLVYPKWSLVTESEFKALPTDSFFGLDFGFSKDPTALVELKVVGRKLFVKERLYSTQLTNSDLIEIFANLQIEKNSYIFADSASPDRITELQKARYNVHPAIKGQNSVYAGILKVSDFELFVCEGSPNLEFELANYKFKEDASGEPLASVVDSENHALDAMRYAIYTHEYGFNKGIIGVSNTKKNANRNNITRRRG